MRLDMQVDEADAWVDAADQFALQLIDESYQIGEARVLERVGAGNVGRVSAHPRAGVDQ